MILGQDIWSEMKIDLCLYKNKTSKYGGACEVCMPPMKEISNINFNPSSNWIKYGKIWNKDL